MKPIILTLKKKLKYRLDASFLTLETVDSYSKFINLKVLYGRKIYKLREIFNIKGNDIKNIIIKSSSSKIDNIGFRMKNINLTVFGNVGNFFGKQLQSGNLNLHGNALDYTASGMCGGSILIKGNVGDYFCGKPNGINEGISDGTIFIKGNIGNFCIQRMRRGIIIIGGNIGDYACSNMISGTVIIKGKIGKNFCEKVKRGTIITTQKNITSDYILSNNTNLNFFTFYIKQIYTIINQKIFHKNIAVDRFYGKKNEESLAEVFLIKN